MIVIGVRHATNVWRNFELRVMPVLMMPALERFDKLKNNHVPGWRLHAVTPCSFSLSFKYCACSTLHSFEIEYALIALFSLSLCVGLRYSHVMSSG